ncbi:hypothetical protein P4S95_27975 [Aneurinibacillus aneurinilyticus]|nr:hypothetical protein [Aneurinibacillus aneurinilyticus]MED0673975.1 hypothetical protein [Aneurinibacillus aneurinilyticus]
MDIGHMGIAATYGFHLTARQALFDAYSYSTAIFTVGVIFSML